MKTMTTFANLSTHGEINQYVDHISNDFNSNKRQELESTDKGSHMALLFVEHNAEGKAGEMLMLEVISSATIKAVFSSYAEKRGGVSLRSFQFSFNDKHLFLSQIAKRTLVDLDWKDQDVITVHALESPQQSNISNPGQNGLTVSYNLIHCFITHHHPHIHPTLHPTHPTHPHQIHPMLGQL